VTAATIADVTLLQARSQSRREVIGEVEIAANEKAGRVSVSQMIELEHTCVIQTALEMLALHGEA
jgi:hypothetical protein